uniref:Uncharacterized protein n=1 Tax=Rhizophora mucronata TaxID=61149 RepID=A0A2P2NXC0_RHIMU
MHIIAVRDNDLELVMHASLCMHATEYLKSYLLVPPRWNCNN